MPTLNLQSMLDPIGVEATRVAGVWWIMLAGGLLILALVTGLLLYALLRAPSRRRRIHPIGLIVAGGVALPVLTLSALLVASLMLTADLRSAPKGEALEIEVVGHQGWWELHYRSGEQHDLVAYLQALE